MKRNISAWRILAVPEDLSANPNELQALLTLGSGTATRMRTVILWWAAPGAKQFLQSSTGSSRSH